MKIVIGGKNINVPDFIAHANPDDKARFHVFLKEVLSAQAEKIRNHEEMKEFNADNIFSLLFGGMK